MRLNKGEKINAFVVTSGVLSQMRYEVEVVDLLYEGENFNIYLGEDVRGAYVCLKAIRYSIEQRDCFPLARDYILYKRETLVAEHCFLGVSHPYLPEPIAMLNMQNDTTEDQRLFRGVAEWEILKSSEPILIEEYLTGTALTKLTEALRSFSLARRINIVKRVARFCCSILEQGYLIYNLYPSNILLKPNHDDNIYFIALYNSHRETDGKVDSRYFALNQNSTGYRPLECHRQEHNYDERVNVFHLGTLLYYLITLEDISKDTGWRKKNVEYLDPKRDRKHLEKSIRSLDTSAVWLVDLMLQALEPRPEFRIPNIATFLDYLERPPQDKVVFKIKNLSHAQTVIKLTEIPAWSKNLKVRLEVLGHPQIFRGEYPCNNTLHLPTIGSGKVICSISATDGKQKNSWWEFQESMILPEVSMRFLEDVSPNKFKIEWDKANGFHHISVRVKDQKGNVTALGNFVESGVELPPDHISLPFYELLEVECVSYFYFVDEMVKGSLFSERLRLSPPISVPLCREIPEGLQLETVISQKQAQLYTDIEVIHNGWPLETDEKKYQPVTSGQQRVTFFIRRNRLNIFENHSFAFRVLIQDLGWRTGPATSVTVSPQAVANLRISDEQPGCVRLQWDMITHYQWEGYEIKWDQTALLRCRTPFYALQLPLKEILQNKCQEVDISVYGIYKNGETEILSVPSAVKFRIGEWRSCLKSFCEREITPLFVSFHLFLEHPEAVGSISNTVVLRRRNIRDDTTISLANVEVASELLFRDDQVEAGECYVYSIVLQNFDIQLIETDVQIPPIVIEGKLQQTGYENCVWEIHINSATVDCIDGEIEILRQGNPGYSHTFSWPRGEQYYCFRDEHLLPGESYHYVLIVKLADQSSPRTYDLGTVVTPKFHVEENVQVGYNHAVIYWSPLPVGHIECIEIYDGTARLIGTTQSDSVTLENLEPQKTYAFSFKYRYLSGTTMDGQEISFTTQNYHVPIKIMDLDYSSFRMRWDIPDLGLMSKLRDFILEVGENIGTHKLGANARSLQLRYLYPSTTYHWKLQACFKSGSTSMLATGEVTTEKPAFTVDIEVGLVHHIQWNYPSCPGIDKIEVHRDDTLVLETSEKEMYDSDFKGTQDVTYKFYYVMKDGRRIVAAEKKIKPLSMKELYSAIKIEPGIGQIQWDFDNLKKFLFLKYVELFRNQQSLYKQGSHLHKLCFEDFGEVEGNEQIGLTGDPMNFQLDVVGVAPIARKCKKKWVLNIKGIQCNYPKFPTNFQVFREYSCIYFTWDYTPTDLLKEITLWRAVDGLIVYQGTNEPVVVYDDNQGKGIEPSPSYLYCLQMDYKNYNPTPENCNDYFEELDHPFDPVKLEKRLDINFTIAEAMEVSWNNDLNTSVSHIRCEVSHGVFGKLSRFSKLFRRSRWIEIPAGKLTVLLPSSPVFQFRLSYQDYYGYKFSGPVHTSETINAS